jgi:NAD(P)H-hydrate repair Nnr-like enzyme with NAD(P)H-hydrate dehydratase domain
MNPLEAYLKRADEIIGDRTLAEQRYDREVIRWMRKGKDVKRAVAKANQKYPSEALLVDADSLPAVQAHYEYLAEHEMIIERLNKLEETRNR